MSWDPNVPGSTAQSSNQETPPQTTNAVPSAARTTSGNSGSLIAGGADSISLLIDVTAASGVTPSMTLAVEWSNNGADWFAATPADTLGAAITAVTKRQQTVTVKAPFYRITWVITGTTPSFTFAVHAHHLD